MNIVANKYDPITKHTIGKVLTTINNVAAVSKRMAIMYPNGVFQSNGSLKDAKIQHCICNQSLI